MEEHLIQELGYVSTGAVMYDILLTLTMYVVMITWIISTERRSRNIMLDGINDINEDGSRKSMDYEVTFLLFHILVMVFVLEFGQLYSNILFK